MSRSVPTIRGAAVRLVLALAAMIALSLAIPAAASAHATLIETAPSDQQVVPTAPARVTLTFNEPVETSLGSIRVFDGDAARVDTGDPIRVSPDAVATALRPDLPNGTYTVSFSVLSGDGHPIDGAFVFHIGAPGANPGGVDVGGGASGAVKRAANVAQFLDLALLIALVGGIAALLMIFAGVDRDLERRLWHVVAGVGFGLSVAAGATIVLQAAVVTGVGVGGATRGGVLSAVLDTRFGHVRLAQLIGAEVIAIAAVWAATARSRAYKWGIGALAVALATTPGLSGHAGQNGAFAVVADTAHVLAASTWVGGLATVMLALIMVGAGARGQLARTVFPRFSTAALASVCVLLVAGTIGGFKNVDSLGQLTSTTYGRLLLAKIAIAAGLIGLGAASRSTVKRLRDETGEAPLARLRKGVIVELVLMTAAIGVTSVLVSEPPATSVAAAVRPPAATATIDDLQARVVVDPGRTGPNTVHVYLSASDKPVSVDEVTVNAAPSAGGQGPFRLLLAEKEAGHYVSKPLQASADGPWTLDIAVRRGDFDLKGATVTIPIRKAAP